MKDKPQFLSIIWRVKYFSFFIPTYLKSIALKSIEKCANYKPQKYTYTINMSQVRIFYDVVLADYEVSPSCRLSHATAQLIKVMEILCISTCSVRKVMCTFCIPVPFSSPVLTSVLAPVFCTVKFPAFKYKIQIILSYGYKGQKINYVNFHEELNFWLTCSMQLRANILNFTIKIFSFTTENIIGTKLRTWFMPYCLKTKRDKGTCIQVGYFLVGYIGRFT